MTIGWPEHIIGITLSFRCRTASTVFQWTRLVVTCRHLCSCCAACFVETPSLTCIQVEQQRLDDQYNILRELFNERTVFSPFPPTRNRNDDSPPTALDCGFGSGAWIEHLMDDLNGECDVSLI